MFIKNAAVTGFQIGHFIQIAGGAAKTTGTPTCKRLLDGVGAALTNAASYNSDAGAWEIDLDAADMDADLIGLSFTLADCLPISYTIRTTTLLVDASGAINSVSGTVGSIATDGITAAAVSAAAASKIAAAVIAGGTGTYSYTNTVDDGSGNLLDGVFVQCATDSAMTNIVYTTHTNSLGAYTVYDDVAGTHYIRYQLGGYESETFTVTLA